MKQRNRLSVFLLLVGFVLVSCVDNPEYISSGSGTDTGYEAEMPLDDLTIPGGFSWKTTNTTSLTVSVNDEFNGQYNYLIEVFDQNPFTSPDANLITRGLAKQNKPFEAKVTVPNTVTEVYIRQLSPNGLVNVRMVSVVNETIECDFAQATKKALRSLARSVSLGSVDYTVPYVEDIDIFPSYPPADSEVLRHGNWAPGGISATVYRNYIINSQTPIVTVSPGQYVAIYVTEDATISGFNNIANRKIFILPGRKLTITGGLGASTANWVISVGEGAELEIRGLFKVEQTAKIYNLGVVSLDSYHSVGSAQFYNKGTYQITGSGETAMQVGLTSLFYNDGTVDVAGGWVSTGSATIYNAETATINVEGKINQNTSGNRLINDNVVTCGEYISTGNAGTENNGVMTVAGKTEIRSADTWVNNGTWTTETMYTISYNANYLNSCKLIVNELLELEQARFVNNGGAYIYAKDYNMVNTRMEMGSASLFVVEGTASFKENKPISSEQEGFYGTGEERALLKFAKVVAGNSSPNIVYYGGNLQVACDDHPEATMPSGSVPRWSMDGSVEWASLTNPTITIPKSECNEGSENSTNPPVEPEPQDVVDPYTYTYMFEDEWPLYHDYDMNDIVIRMKDITKTPNKDNQITKLKFTYSLEAVGASRLSAAALMLDGIATSEVLSVTYSGKSPTGFDLISSGLEAGQSKAVIPFFSDAHGFLGKEDRSFINTLKGSSNNVSEVPFITVEVTFAAPVDPANLDVTAMNLFIVTDATLEYLKGNARKEIHLRGYNPTDKANTQLFGCNNDNSKDGALYSSKDNLVWGIVIPSSFRWSVEYRNITVAYGAFANWVQTNGEEDQDWWQDPSNEDNVY